MSPATANRPSRFMDVCARFWLKVGSLFGHRPATVIGITIGAVIFASSMTYVLVQQANTEEEVKRIATAFCNGQAPLDDRENNIRCQALLKRLINEPSPANAAQLRRIVEEK